MSLAGSPKRLAGWLVAIVLLAASVVHIAATFQWARAFEILSRANLSWFVAGGAASLLSYWAVRALRWRNLLANMGVQAPLADLYLASSVAISLSVFTPLQSGEALKVELLRRQEHVTRLPGYSAFAIERAADLYVVAAFGALSLWATTTFSLAVAAATLLVLPLLAFAILHRVRLTGRPGVFVQHLQLGVSDMPALLRLLLLSTAGWLAVAFGWYAALRSVGVDLGLRQALALLSVVTLATIASLVPGGLGIVEAGAAVVLVRFGVDAAHAQAGALALRGLSLLVIALGLTHLLVLRLRAPSRGQAGP